MITTFDNGLYAVLPSYIYGWEVMMRNHMGYYVTISKKRISSKPAAIKWLWDTLQEEHDLSKADDPPSIDGLDI